MEAFARIYQVEISAVKDEYAEEFESWKKLKYSISSSINRLANGKKISEEDAALFRVIISKANVQELEEIKKKIAAIRVGIVSVESLKDKVPRYEELEAVPSRVKLTEEQKQLKLEQGRTIRLINDHKKRGIIDPEEALSRLEHAKTLTTRDELFEYRESLKIKAH
jgi:hypothetical protein